jgi:hypothetical protein
MIEDAAVINALSLLRREWDHAYLVWFQAGRYCACRRDNGAICRRSSAEDLRRDMDTDYRAFPVVGR